MNGRFVAGLLAAGLASASGLATVSTGDLGFSIDTAVFGLSGDTLVLELYEIIDIQQLAAGEEGLALFQTDAVLLDGAGDTTAVQQWLSEVEWIEGRSAVNGTVIPVVPGSYSLFVVVTDLENGLRGTAVRDLDISAPGTLSEIEAANLMVAAPEGSSNPFRKGGLIVFPAADSRFDLPGERTAYLYAEIYGAGGMALRHQSRLVDASGEVLFARPWDVLQIPEGAEAVGIVDSLDLSVARASGLHYFEILVSSGTDTSMATKPLMIVREAPVEIPDTSVAAGQRSLEQFRYLLTTEELGMFDRLVDDESRARFYDAYWAGSPDDRASFEETVVAVDRYSTPFAEGWRTDRGRVHIIYGPPADIESTPFEVDTYPFEIWYYYTEGSDQFVFVDRVGNGNYEQIYSTVDGEVSYPNWEQMLQPIRTRTPEEDGYTSCRNVSSL
jgi:GWxTD domain-containing protein